MSAAQKKSSRIMDDESTVVTRSGRKKIKALSSMRKSVRGLLGIKKKSSRQAVSDSPASTSKGTDDETVYNIELDNASVGSNSVDAAAKSKADDEAGTAELKTDPISPTNLLQIILLLMDPSTRRFELLQMEFDAERAVVSDILAQVPVSSHETTFRNQEYAGVCTRDGTEMINTMKLTRFCSSNDVVVAIPKGMSMAEVSKFSKPILSEPKVAAMIKNNIVNEKSLPTLKEEGKKEEGTSRGLEEKKISRGLEEKKSSKEKSSFFSTFAITMVVSIVVGYGLYVVQQSITAPLAPGDVLAPGEWRSRCGFLSFLPSNLNGGCNEATLRMGNNGMLSFLEGKEMVWQMEGDICDPDDNNCQPGTTVEADGNIQIGDMPVAAVYGDLETNDLTPWPFTMEPWRAKKAPKIRKFS